MADPIDIVFKLQRLICYDEDDGLGDAEPYLWALFFQIDKDTASITLDADGNQRLAGTTSTQSNSGNHENLGVHDVWEGRDIPIPVGAGEFRTKLNPITFRDKAGGAIGCVIVLLEQDNSSGHAVASAHTKFDEKVVEIINRIIPTFDLAKPGITEQQKNDAKAELKKTIADEIWNNTSGWSLLWPPNWDNDDLIGADVVAFSHDELLSFGQDGKTFNVKFENEDEGSWEIQGQVTTGAEPGTTTPTNPSSCFIATAAAGNRNDTAVLQLTRFRDYWLNKRAWGRIFIRCYYACGPYIARLIAKNNLLRKIVYVSFVKPLSKLIKT